MLDILEISVISVIYAMMVLYYFRKDRARETICLVFFKLWVTAVREKTNLVGLNQHFKMKCNRKK